MFRLRMDEFKIYDTGLKVITLIGHLNIHWFCYNYGFSAKSPILILQNLIGIKKKNWVKIRFEIEALSAYLDHEIK